MGAKKIRRKLSAKEQRRLPLERDIVQVCVAHRGEPEALAAILKDLPLATLQAVAEDGNRKDLTLPMLLTLHCCSAIFGDPEREYSFQKPSYAVLTDWCGAVAALVNYEGMRRKHMVEYTFPPDPFHVDRDQPFVEVKRNDKHPFWLMIERLPEEHREPAMRAGSLDQVWRYVVEYLSEDDFRALNRACDEFDASLTN